MSVWKSDEKLLSICILNFSFKNDFVWEEISNIRHSVSSPAETPRSSSKINSAARRIFNSFLGVSSTDETPRREKSAHRLWTKAKLGTSVNALLSLGLKILPYWLDLRLCFLPIKKRMEEVIFYLLFCIMHSTCDQTCLLYSTSRPLLSFPWGFAGIKKGAIFFPCACGYVDYEESPIFPQG